MDAITNLYGKDVRLTQLEYATATLSTGSFSAAAKRCGVSQPALSSGIATLETTLGVQLFERSTSGAVPTEAGQQLLPIVETILRSATHLFVAARQLADGRPTLRLGVSPLVSPGLIAEAFDAFRAAPADIEIAFSEANLMQLRAELSAGRLDVIIVPRTADDMSGTSAEIIASDPLHHIAESPEDVPPTIQLSEVARRRLVLVTEDCGLTELTRSALETIGADIRAHDARATSYQRLVEWSDMGLGDALLPASKVPPGRRSSTLMNGNEPVSIDFEAIWNPSTPGHRDIAAAIGSLASRTMR